MSQTIHYTLSGSIVVDDVPEVDEIAERFQLAAGQIHLIVEENEDDTLTLTFEGTQKMNYIGIAEVDSIAQEFGPYVLYPTYIEYVVAGHIGELFIGPPTD